MELYITKPGDSPRGLARRFETGVGELLALNGLNDPARLIPNLALLVPGGEPADRPEILVGSFAEVPEPETALTGALPGLSFLCLSSGRLTRGGELSVAGDDRLFETAPAAGTALFLTVTNLSESGGYSGEIAHAILRGGAAQDAAADSILAALDRGPYAGVCLNFQYVFPFDREALNRFLRRLSGLLHERGLYLCSCLAPRESADRETPLDAAHDYAAHGRRADWVLLMTCDWGYPWSAPQALSPVDRIRRVLDYAVTQMPPGRILLGLSHGGCRWRLPWRQGDEGEALSGAAAANLAVSVGAELRFDYAAQAPWFTCRDADGRRSAVWFEDARSLRARLALVREYGLAGVCWQALPGHPEQSLQGRSFVTAKLLGSF